MSFLTKPFNDIDFSDIEFLVKNNISENGSLEYKKELWEKNDEGTREMLRDVVAMTNGAGGYIIVGIGEQQNDGAPEEIFNIDNAEEERDRIQSICLSSIEPRIGTLDIKTLSNGEKTIILLKVPYSFRSPHLITFKGLYQFWIRHDRQKSRMSIDEIKDTFRRKANLTNDIEKFLEKRKRIAKESVQAPQLVMGAYPLEQNGDFVDISDQDLRGKMKSQRNARQGGWNLTFVHDAEAKPTYNGLIIGGKQTGKSLEVFRNGYIETHVDLSIRRVIETEEINGVQNRVINSYPLPEYILSFFIHMKTLSEHFGYGGQYFVFVDILSIPSVMLKNETPDTYMSQGDRWSENHLCLGNYSFDSSNIEAATQFVCDRLWQSFGHEKQPFTFEDEKLVEGWR